MIALTPSQIAEFETALSDCARLNTDEQRRQRLNAVADTHLRALLELAIQEPTSARDLKPGTQLGDYELLEHLGAGGFGNVWRARRTGDESGNVAIKLIRPEHLRGASTGRFVKIFEAEIRRHRALDHPGIVKLLASGVAELSGHGEAMPFLVMELCPGQPLDHAGRGRPVERKIACLIQICEAVQYAHQHGLMHLDLKPENILVNIDAGELSPKLLDFGIARNFRAERPLDPKRFGAGTLPYKAPEQLDASLGGEDFRTDVYALGVLLFQVLTDHLPYPIKEGTADEFRKFIKNGPRLQLRDFDESLDEKLQTICNCAISTDRARRYDSPASLASALQQWLRRRQRVPLRRWAVAVVSVLAAGLCFLWPRCNSKATLNPGTDVKWQVIPVTGTDANFEADRFFYDVAWLSDEGWICGAKSEDGNPGKYVGQGFVLHTSDGGRVWQEIPDTNFPADAGVIACFGETWEGLGPLHSIIANQYPAGPNSVITGACVAGTTGVYLTTNAYDTNAKWARLASPPDGPDCYSYFNGFWNISHFEEMYAFGWQGIARHRQDGSWTIEMDTHDYAITGLMCRDGPNDGWAVSGFGNGSRSRRDQTVQHGAIFHHDTQSGKWHRVSLPENIFDTDQQNLTGILVSSGESYIVVIGSDGLILRGRPNATNWNWERIVSGTKQNLNCISRDVDRNLWIVGNAGTILRSRDDGVSWREYPASDKHGNSVRDSFMNIHFSNKKGWIIGGHTLLRCEFP